MLKHLKILQGSKLLMELSTDEHETTFINVTHILSEPDLHTKLQVAEQPSTTPSTSEADL